jgi:MFS family permease
MIKFFRKNIYLLSFGMLQIFFTAPGQTFLVSLFVKAINTDMGISHSLFAGIYSFATLAGALFLNIAGRFIDKYPPKKVLFIVIFSFAAGCFLLANSYSVIALAGAFFLLRFFGQGVFGLLGSTVIARNFKKNRGKAMGIATLGFPLNEAIYPSLALWMLVMFGWRNSYLVFGLITIVLMLPLQHYLLDRALKKRTGSLPEDEEYTVEDSYLDRNAKDFTLAEALRDYRFYLIIIASCIPPVAMTGLLFHQHVIFANNSWPIIYAATGLSVYAFAKAIGSVGIGWVVDRYGPFYPFFMLIVLIGLGTLMVAIGGPFWMSFLYFALMGAALGFSSPVINVVYANLYGTKHFGSIKGFVQIFRNGLTALGPLPIAIALDMGYSIKLLLFLTSGLIFALSLFPLFVKRQSV